MTECAICFNELTAATGRSVMSCGHEFHIRCLVQWLQKPDGTASCPCCRREPTEFERLAAPPEPDSDYPEEDFVDDDDRLTALMAAAYAGDVALVERLLTTGGVGIDGEGRRSESVPLPVLLEERDSEGDTALVHAVVGGNRQIVEMLLSAGAEIDTQNEDHMTPLMWAITDSSDSRIALDLVERGADLDVVSVSTGYSALEFAADHDHIHVLLTILEHGAGRLGEALHAACGSGSRASVRALLDAGADPNYRVSGGRTPLMTCVSRSPDHEIVTELIRRGADVLAADEDGWNVLMWMSQADEAPDSDIMAAILDEMVRATDKKKVG